MFDSRTGALVDGATVSLVDDDRPARDRCSATTASAAIPRPSSAAQTRHRCQRARLSRRSRPLPLPAGRARAAIHLKVDAAGQLYRAVDRRPRDARRAADPTASRSSSTTPASAARFTLSTPEPFYADIPLDQPGDAHAAADQDRVGARGVAGRFRPVSACASPTAIRSARADSTSTDMLPAGLRYERGSARGARRADRVERRPHASTSPMPALAAGALDRAALRRQRSRPARRPAKRSTARSPSGSGGVDQQRSRGLGPHAAAAVHRRDDDHRPRDRGRIAAIRSSKRKGVARHPPADGGRHVRRHRSRRAVPFRGRPRRAPRRPARHRQHPRDARAGRLRRRHAPGGQRDLALRRGRRRAAQARRFPAAPDRQGAPPRRRRCRSRSPTTPTPRATATGWRGRPPGIDWLFPTRRPQPARAGRRASSSSICPASASR